MFILISSRTGERLTSKVLGFNYCGSFTKMKKQHQIRHRVTMWWGPISRSKTFNLLKDILGVRLGDFFFNN